MSAIPRSRDDALYSKVLETIRLHPSAMLAAEIKLHKNVAPLLKDKRPGRINEVILCLQASRKIQVGYNVNGNKLIASMDKPFPGSKEPPTRPDGKPKWFRGTAAASHNATAATEAPPAAVPEAPPAAAPTAAPAIPPSVASPFVGLVNTETLDTMAQQFADTIAGALCVRIVQSLHAQLPAHIGQIVQTYSNGDQIMGKNGHDKTPPKIGVIVAGLLKHQCSLIEDEFGKELDLAFLHSDEHGKRVQTLLQSHHVAFGMLKFIPHALDGQLKKARRYRQITGGMSALRDNLRAIVATKGEYSLN